MLLLYATKLSRDRDLAEDAVQCAMLNAWVNADKFIVGSNFAGWMMTIVRNECFSRMKYEKRRRAEDINGEAVFVADASPLQDEKMAASQEVKFLLDQIKHLPWQMREAVTLVSSGLSYLAAAEVAGTSEGTIKSRLHRSRQALLRHKRIAEFL